MYVKCSLHLRFLHKHLVNTHGIRFCCAAKFQATHAVLYTASAYIQPDGLSLMMMLSYICGDCKRNSVCFNHGEHV